MNCLSKAVIRIGEKASQHEKQAALELQRYVYRITHRLPEIVRRDHSGPGEPGPAVLIGSWQSNPAFQDRELWETAKGYASRLGEEGFLICPHKNDLIIVGGSELACLYAVYHLLEEYGAAFHLGGDTLPKKDCLPFPQEPMVGSPAFSIRGSLPWYNFFNSPTTWNLQDYQFFFDQMVKMKNNFVGFHVYDVEPFAAYEEDGVYHSGEPLATTEVATWGSIPTRTHEFGFGTHALFDREAFGADAAFADGDRNEKIRSQQELLAEALRSGKSKGLKVCLGFEIGGDPTAEAEQVRLEKRLKHLLKTYPMLDYVWLWQPECWCTTEIQEGVYHGAGFPFPSHRSDFGTALREYGGAFSYLPDLKKVHEGVRIGLYARFAHKLLKSLSPDTRLILSGWGGDKWLRFSDLYKGLDRILPKDIVFSALDNIDPMVSQTVSQHYGEVPGREVWPIPWFEYDGDQWCPQPYVKQYARLLKDALDKGSRGILGIHWRTRGVEEIASYTAQFSWNPGLGAEEFFSRYARGLYGDQLAEEMAALHLRLHDLGYRWCGGGGQSECAPFRWVRTPGAEQLEKLRGIEPEVRSLLTKAREKRLWSACENLGYLHNTIRWIFGYEQAADFFHDQGDPGLGVKLIIQAEQAVSEGDFESAGKRIEQAFEVMRRCGLREAMAALAKTVSNRGELGVLATVNAKAYADYKQKLDKLVELSRQIGQESPDLSLFTEMDPGSEPEILCPVRNAEVDAHVELEILTFGDVCKAESLQATFHYRSVGQQAYEKVPMNRTAAGVFRGRFPQCADGDLLEGYFDVAVNGQSVGTWPCGAPDRVSLYRFREQKVGMGIRSMPFQAVRLQWESAAGAARYHVYRTDEASPREKTRIASCIDLFYEDYKIEEDRNYCYTVIPVSGSGMEMEGKTEFSIETDEFAVQEVPDVKAFSPYKGKVYLSWDDTGLGVREFRVYEAQNGSGEWKLAKNGIIRKTEDGYQRFGWVGNTDGVASCKVAAVGWNGREGRASEPVEADLGQVEAKPLLQLDLNGGLANEQGLEGTWQTFPLFDKERGGLAAKMTGSNMIYFQPDNRFNPQFEITLAAWIKPWKAQGSVIAHGMTGFTGYLLDFRQDCLHFYLSGVGDLQAPFDRLNQWCHVAAAYDGEAMRILVDGSRVAEQKANGRFYDFSGQLRIGQGFEGLMQDICVFPVGLSDFQLTQWIEKKALPINP